MIEVRTPCRLHFGLLAYSHDDARQFGGVGLMIHRPDLTVRFRESDELRAVGPMAERAELFARRFLDRAQLEGLTLPAAAIEVLRIPRAHVGLGTGTQLGLAIAQGLCELGGLPAMPAPRLAQWVGRGERSAIGVHGFAHGGLIVEGGKLDPDAVSPLLLRHELPEPWRIVLVIPEQLRGLSGQRERDAFARMPAIPPAASGGMCRHVLLGLIPALIEGDLDDFGRALYELQRTVGECFAQAQGGIYGDPLLERIVGFVRARGVHGVGQSSWGPTLYAFTRDEPEAQRLAEAIRKEFRLSPGEVFVTRPENRGASVHKPMGNAV